MIEPAGRVILRWELSISKVRILKGMECILRVNHKGDDKVEFWALHSPEGKNYETRIVGTGHPFSGGWQPGGTSDRTPGGLVWHVLVRRLDD